MSALYFFRYHYHFFVVLIISILFTNCSKNLAGTEVTNEEAVKLVGKVLDQKGAGVPNIIAKIDKLHIADTTDSGGNYSFEISSNALKNMGVDLDKIKDSVKIYNTGTVVSVLAITKWIDTLPQVYLVQRNIYGTLFTDSTNFKKIEAVLTIYNKNDSIIGTMVKKLWFNNGTMGFSGFIYFPTNSTDLKYRVFVNVYRTDSLLSGKSKTVLFDDNAGDVEIPAFNPFTCNLQIFIGNDTKIFIGKDTTLTIKDTIKLSIQRVGDSLSKITKYEWNFNNTGFIASSNNIGTFVLPDTECVIECIGRVTDEFGNVALNQIKIKCLKNIPEINFQPVTPLGFNSEGTISAFVYDEGKIVSWKWKIGNNLLLRQSDSIKASTVSFTVPQSYSPLPCTLTVTDDDNNQVTKSIVLSIGKWEKQNNATVPFDMIHWTLYNDSIFLAGSNGYILMFYTYDQKYVLKPIYNEIDTRLPEALLVSTDGKCFIYRDLINRNMKIYKEQNSNFVCIDSLSKELSFSAKFTILDNGALCISDISSGKLTFYSYADSNWTEKNIELPFESDNPIISSLVSVGNDCYLAVGAGYVNPSLYKFDGNTITSINIGNYPIYNYLSISKSGSNLYINGNYYGNSDSYDSTLTFIHMLKGNTIVPVIKDIGGLSSTQPDSGGHLEKHIIEVAFIDSSLYLGISGSYSRQMVTGIYSSLVYRLEGNKLEQIGNTITGSSSEQMKIFKKNDQLYLIAERGNVYTLK